MGDVIAAYVAVPTPRQRADARRALMAQRRADARKSRRSWRRMLTRRGSS